MTKSILIAIVVVFASSAFSAAAAERAIWTWEQDSYALVEDRAFADEAIAFLRAKHVDTIYLYADAYQGRNLIESRPDAYRQLIRRLHRRGMRAYALLGSAYLHTEAYILPSHRQDAVAMFQRVLDYNAAASPDERFDGVNLDIEPHILEQWDTQRDGLLLHFLDMGQELMALKRKSGLSLAVGPAMPFWFDGIELDWRGVKKPVSEHVFDIYDYAALMDYRDHAQGGDGIIDHASNEMTYADSHHKRVVIGVEVTPSDIQKVSFDHLAEPDLERELRLVEQAYRDSPAFAGFAIHHFRGYRAWLARERARH
ncbi:MAG TPA: hypothetical protein VHF02_10795 [Luteimonas sp.]|nr:hypothetical protein [Luteimonas sp.]